MDDTKRGLPLVSMSLSAVAVAVILSQAVVRPPARIGDVAHELSAEDIADIERIVSPYGGSPWLLIGTRGMIADLQVVEAYQPPTVATREVRRGSFIVVLRGTADALASAAIPRPSRPGGWIMGKTESYAQVTLAGRDFDQVEGEDDLNRPFRLVGKFDDRELVNLVRFVRSSPTGPMLGRGAATDTVRGDWPVAAIVRQTDAVDVRLSKDPFTSQLVTLRATDSGWLIVSISIRFV